MGLANDSNLAVSPLFWCILGMGIAMETETKKDIEIYFHFSDFFLFLTISLLLKYYVEGYREVSGTDRIK